MFPYFTRIFWLLVQPLSLLLLLLLLALVLSFLGSRWPLRIVLALSVVGLSLLAFSTAGYLAMQPLEQRFSRPAEPERIDGIVVLGGGLEQTGNSGMNWELGRSGDRFVEAARLALRHPDARILLTGGAPALVDNLEPEAVAAQRFMEDFGIPRERILLEPNSRNTEENAQFAKALAAPEPGETWLLITSAFHMPRSIGLFRRAGFTVIPWPTDYLAASQSGFRLKPDETVDNLAVSHIAIREWLGLLGYYATGRIDELLPGP